LEHVQEPRFGDDGVVRFKRVAGRFDRFGAEFFCFGAVAQAVVHPGLLRFFHRADLPFVGHILRRHLREEFRQFSGWVLRERLRGGDAERAGRGDAYRELFPSEFHLFFLLYGQRITRCSVVKYC
jgi:hypothetical protein